MDFEKVIAENLLEIKAVSLRPNEPYVWASGIKSPIYCDNRFVLSFPQKRDVVVAGFKALIEKAYPQAESIMGTATAGIPWAALVASAMNKPMGYVRASNKDHGKGNKIEDLISTGGSVKGVVEALRDAGVEVLGVVAIFTYLLPAAEELFSSIHCECRTLSNYDVLVEAALEHHYIKDSDLEKLKAWKRDPHDESWIER